MTLYPIILGLVNTTMGEGIGGVAYTVPGQCWVNCVCMCVHMRACVCVGEISLFHMWSFDDCFYTVLQMIVFCFYTKDSILHSDFAGRTARFVCRAVKCGIVEFYTFIEMLLI